MQKMNEKIFAEGKPWILILIMIVAVAVSAAVSAYFIGGELTAYADGEPIEAEVVSQPKLDAGSAPTITVVNYDVDYDSATHTIDEADGHEISVVADGKELLQSDYRVTYKSDTYTETTTAPSNAGEYTVLVKITNTADYQQAEATAILTIKKIDPVVTFKGDLTQQYDYVTPCTVTFSGKYGEFTETPAITYSFGDVATVRPDVGEYTLSASFAGNANYKPASIEKTLKIVKRNVYVSFSGGAQFIYTGYGQTRVITRTGVLSDDADTFELLVSYNGLSSAVNVGTYDIEVELNNTNYVIADISGGTVLEIMKKPLTVVTPDVSISYGETPNIVYRYVGFVLSDNEENSIETEPSIAEIPTDIGRYTITPQGAVAQNYSFTYMAGTLVINSVSLSGSYGGEEGEDVIVKGVFQPETTVSTASYNTDDSSIAVALATVYAHNQIISDKDVLGAYSVRLTNGGMVGDTIQITLTGVKLQPLYKTKIGVVDKNGNFYIIEKYSYDKETGTIVFNSHYDGTVFVYRNAKLTYIAAGIAAVIVIAIIVLLISAEVLYKKRKRSGYSVYNAPREKTPYELAHKKYKW